MIQVVERVFDVIEYMSDNPEKVFTSGQIAEYLEVGNTTCNNILRTLLKRNYLEQENTRGAYRLGPMLLHVGRNLNYQKELIEITRPFAEEFTQRSGESSNLVILRNYHRFVLYSIESTQVIQIRSEVRPDDNLYISATARTLTAYASESELKLILKRNGLPSKSIWPEAAGKRGLENALAEIRSQGYGLAIGANPDVAGGAMPIRKNGKVVAVLGYWLPAFRYTKETGATLLKELKKSCRGAEREFTRRIKS